MNCMSTAFTLVTVTMMLALQARGILEKDPGQMSEYEATLLAGVPNAPSKYAPTKNPEMAAKRQLKVVERMEDCGYFSETEAETVAETVAVQMAARP